MRNLKILKYDNVYNTNLINTTIIAVTYITMLIRRQCSISRSYINSIYNITNTITTTPTSAANKASI